MPRLNDGTRTGGEILVDQLRVHGVEHVFCVPGESYLAVLDAFYGRAIQLTVCRQEGGAAIMAEAVGKVTNRPGIAFVTRGPGITNASAGIHIAQQDSTPLIVFAGQVARKMRGRDAFQEVDYRACFGSMCKWVTEIDDPARIPELVSRAFYTATSGRPGPVVIALPEDMLTDRAITADAMPFEPVETHVGDQDMEKLQAILSGAERPIILVGGSNWSAEACASLARFADRFAIPVATTFRRAHLMDALHPSYAGDLGIGPNPNLLDRIKSSDVVVLIGGRLSEIPSQAYTLLSIPGPAQIFVHAHAGVEELGRVYQPHLALNASPKSVAVALDKLTPPAEIVWRRRTETAHDDYLKWTEKPTWQPGEVNLGEVMVWLRENLPKDTFICNGAGNFSSWVHRFFRFRYFNQNLAPNSGSMGYGLPAAVAVKRLYPERPVVCIAGDGDFLMHGQEFMTAVQYGLPIIVVVADNGLFGTIRMHQEREYPGRVIATSLRNPDFAAYATAFGGIGLRVERTAEFPAAYEAALKSGRPALIHLKIDADAISPSSTLMAIREKSLVASGRGQAASKKSQGAVQM